MNAPGPREYTHEFRSSPRYVAFLWGGVALAHAGLAYLIWAPRYGAPPFDRSSWIAWILFDVFLFTGSIHATRFRVLVDDGGLSFLAWYFRWVRWDWEEVHSLERLSLSALSRLVGQRYRVSAGRGNFHFATGTLQEAGALAELIVERADLDDLGEVEMAFQEGTKHVWAHPHRQE